MIIEPTTVVRYPAIESRMLLTQSIQNTATKGQDWYLYFYVRTGESRRIRSMTVSRSPASPQPQARISNMLTAHGAPRESELGRRLRTLRTQIIQSGEPLLDWEQIEAELAERRGER